jgi:hypothetical protein
VIEAFIKHGADLKALGIDYVLENTPNITPEIIQFVAPYNQGDKL